MHKVTITRCCTFLCLPMFVIWVMVIGPGKEKYKAVVRWQCGTVPLQPDGSTIELPQHPQYGTIKVRSSGQRHDRVIALLSESRCVPRLRCRIFQSLPLAIIWSISTRKRSADVRYTHTLLLLAYGARILYCWRWRRALRHGRTSGEA